MDSARDFDLLGESVPRVRVSARALALLGFINFNIYIYSGPPSQEKAEAQEKEHHLVQSTIQSRRSNKHQRNLLTTGHQAFSKNLNASQDLQQTHNQGELLLPS